MRLRRRAAGLASSAAHVTRRDSTQNLTIVLRRSSNSHRLAFAGRETDSPAWSDVPGLRRRIA